MKFLVVLYLLCSFSAVAQVQPANSVCTPRAEVERDLKRMNFSGPTETNLEQRRRTYRELLQRYPDDLFVHREAIATVLSTPQQTALVDEYRVLEERHPQSLQNKYLYARSLVGVDTPQAMDILRRVEAEDPHYPWPYLEFAEIYDRGRWVDIPKVRVELGKFFEECPTSLDRQALYLVKTDSSPEMAARFGQMLRERLMRETDRDRLRFYKTVWTLEFKAVPVAKHPEVRARVKQDVERLEQMPGNDDAKWLDMLGTGYGLAEDEAGKKRIEEKLLRKYPTSEEAEAIVGERWMKAHPTPEPGASDEKKQNYYRALVQLDDNLLKASPRSSYLLLYRFMWIRELNDVTAEQLTTVAEQLRKAMGTDPIWQAYPPVEFQIAEAYNKKKIHAEQIAGLVEAGLRGEREHSFTSDSETDAQRADDTEGNVKLHTQAADLLVDAAGELKNPEIARGAVKELDSFTPYKAVDQSAIWAVKGKFAELEGRKLDALLMYEAAIKSRPADYDPGKQDKVGENEARLWKELGGTTASHDLWEKKTRATAVATESRWEVPKKAMPAWELSDLHGRTWRMASLEGKTVLISVWGTWCSPCKAELPQVQKLYDLMKDRPDVQVLSFNVDDEVGKVEPFIRKQGYTFPVLLAKDYVGDLLPDVGIPRIWIVDASGKWRWEQVGFDWEKGHWLDSVLEKTAGLGKTPGGGLE